MKIIIICACLNLGDTFIMYLGHSHVLADFSFKINASVLNEEIIDGLRVTFQLIFLLKYLQLIERFILIIY